MFPTRPLQLDDTTDSKSLPSSSVTSSSSSSTKKRHLSQSSLDVYFVSSLSSGSGSVLKKTSKTVGNSEKSVSKKENKKNPGKSKKPAATKSPTKPPTKRSTPKTLVLVTNNSSSSGSMPSQSTGGVVTHSPPRSQAPRTPVKTPTKSPLLSRTTSTSVIMSAKKTRTLKQIREQLKRKFLTTEHRMRLEGEMKRKLDEKKEERKKVRE